MQTCSRTGLYDVHLINSSRQFQIIIDAFPVALSGPFVGLALELPETPLALLLQVLFKSSFGFGFHLAEYLVVLAVRI